MERKIPSPILLSQDATGAGIALRAVLRLLGDVKFSQGNGMAENKMIGTLQERVRLLEESAAVGDMSALVNAYP